MRQWKVVRVSGGGAREGAGEGCGRGCGAGEEAVQEIERQFRSAHVLTCHVFDETHEGVVMVLQTS